jgi:hypothetical protein
MAEISRVFFRTFKLHSLIYPSAVIQPPPTDGAGGGDYGIATAGEPCS